MTGRLSSLVRAFEAEARLVERTRLLEAISDQATSDEAAARSSRRPGVTGAGRRASHLRWMVERLDHHVSAWAEGPGELVGDVAGDCDAVEVYLFDRDDAADEDDPMPVRIVVSDDADSVTASAYLSIEDGEKLHQLLGQALTDIRARRAARAVDSSEVSK